MSIAQLCSKDHPLAYKHTTFAWGLSFTSSFASWAVVVLLSFTTSKIQARDYQLPVTDWYLEKESCPFPTDIKNKGGIFSSPGKHTGVYWAGVLVEGATEEIQAFEKGVFILTEQGYENRGFINGCTYLSSSGKRVHMRLEFDGTNKVLMQVGRSPSWRESRDFRTSGILECTDQFRGACAFSLKLDGNTHFNRTRSQESK